MGLRPHNACLPLAPELVLPLSFLPLLRSPVPALLDSLQPSCSPCCSGLKVLHERFPGTGTNSLKNQFLQLSRRPRDPQLDVDQQSKVQSRLLKSKVGSYLDTFTATRHVWQHSVQR